MPTKIRASTALSTTVLSALYFLTDIVDRPQPSPIHPTTSRIIPPNPTIPMWERAGNRGQLARLRGFARFEGACSLFINVLDEKVFTTSGGAS
ncbi:MAG TPA: hypothetical protein VK726_20080, partial [Acetobacteraceae bacterium]|nr:hypothetical protein [Acetobacteraceae bacterium]